MAAILYKDPRPLREVAPQAATRDMFLDDKGNVVPGRSTATALAAGIPATFNGGNAATTANVGGGNGKRRSYACADGARS